jgi:hypothetical protein
MAVIFPPYSGGSGGGAVDSVNGQTGAVVLTATDVGAPTIAQYNTLVGTVGGMSDALGQLTNEVDTKANQTDLTALTTRVTDLEDAGFVTSSDGTVTDIRALTQTAYDALTPDATTHYDIKP